MGWLPRVASHQIQLGTITVRETLHYLQASSCTSAVTEHTRNKVLLATNDVCLGKQLASCIRYADQTHVAALLLHRPGQAMLRFFSC